MKHNKFNKKRLALAISIIVGSAVAPSVYAQEEAVGKTVDSADNSTVVTDAQLEEAKKVDGKKIEVIGIRGSLIRAMDIKRANRGVVDAISSEEMGKFPDTNLAESLQRITGVSVSRSNGEGSEITVRGFGPNFNLVTLNGRQMPGTGNTRSYSLENLSPSGVDTLEVYKTARAELPSGGLGATVNIITARPLSSPGLKYSVSGKGLADRSNQEGSDLTPEMSALYSNTFADDTFGVAVSYSYQERDWQEQSAGIGGWKADLDLGNATGENAIDNRPDCGTDDDGNVVKCGHTYMPQGFGNTIRDAQRARTNAMLTLQYAPTENFVATLDYTTTETETANESMSFGLWFNAGAGINSYELDENGTAIKFNESRNDYAHTARKSTTLVEADSIGINFDWQATDSLNFTMDYHDSSNAIDFGADKGSGSSPFLIMAPNNLISKTYDYTQGDIPQMTMFWPGGAAEASPSDFDFLFGQFNTAAGEATVEQLQLDGEWVLDGVMTSVKFGLGHNIQNIGGYSAGNDLQGPSGYLGNEAVYPDSMFTRRDTGSFLDQFDGGGNDLATNYYYDYDFDDVLSRSVAYFDYMLTDPFATGGKDSLVNVEEASTSAYVQTAFEFEISDMPVSLFIGARYEKTDVTSDVLQRIENQIVWRSGSEWALTFKEGANSNLESTGDYSLFLPSVDMNIEVTDEVMVRASVGKSIARPPLGSLAGIRSLSPNPKIGARTGSSGNTSLKPFVSLNFDLSVEYYYAEGSYASIGFFKKDVENFITTTKSEVFVEGLNDPYLGPRAQQAIAQLQAEGIAADPQAIFDRIIANGGGVENPITGAMEIVQSADDPTLQWTVSQPSNGDEKSVEGIELALQHMFGESGFGASFNATIVDGDVDFDVASHDVQSPLTGLGDSANAQLFYEKDGLSVKLTYNWRDQYLVGVGQEQGSAEAPPQFAKAYASYDASINYDVTENLTVFIEGVNLSNETEEIFGRYEEQFLRASQYGTRYAVGARYSF